MKLRMIIFYSLFCITNCFSATQQETKQAESTSKSSLLDTLNPFKSDYVKTLAALREMEDVLKEIDRVNKEILDKRKKKDEEIRTQKTKLSQNIREFEVSLKNLRNEIEAEFLSNIKDLERRIASNEGNINELKSALKQENTLLTTAKTANAWTMGWLQYAVDWASSADKVKRDDLHKQIKKLDDDITKWQKELSNNKEKMKKIFSSEAYKQRQQEIFSQLDKAKSSLKIITDGVDILEKKIIEDYSSVAEKLIARLKQLIKQAGCSTIKTIADAKPATIKACKERYLERIKKAYPKSATCQRLTIDSSIEEIKKCK